MSYTTMKRLSVIAAATCLAVFVGAPSQAAIINLNVEGLDLQYSGVGGAIFDESPATGKAGGSRLPNEANQVDAATFTLDGIVQEQYMASDSIYGDIKVENLPATLTAPDISGVSANPVEFTVRDNPGVDNFDFGFSWFQHVAGSVVSGLDLNFDQVIVSLTDTGAAAPIVTISASTTDWSQFNLPDGLEFAPGTPLSFSYTSQNVVVFPPDAGFFDTIMAKEGVLTISGEAIPEPAAAYIMLASLGGLAAAVRFRLG